MQKPGKLFTKKVDRCDKKEMEWMRASASMPIVSKPVCVDGYELLDGGVADSIPVQKMQELGFDKTVVVLTQPRDYVKKKNQLMPLAKVSLRRYPAMIDAWNTGMSITTKNWNISGEKKNVGNCLSFVHPKR